MSEVNVYYNSILRNAMKKLFVFVAIGILFILGQNANAQVLPPSNLTVVQVNHGEDADLLLTWNPSATEGVKYTIYKKYAGLNAPGTFKVKASKVRDTSFVDSDETPGDTLCYYVVAVKDTAKSVPSNTVEIVVAEPPSIKGFVKGVVTADSTNLPLARVQVKLYKVNRECNQEDFMTDSTGAFFAKVDSGKYFVSYRKTGYVTEYFDNVSGVQYATPVQITVGDTISCSAGLAKYWPAPTYTLKGKVTDTLGNGLKATVRIFKLRTNTFHWSNSSTKTDETGNYTFSVKGGDTVVVYAEAYKSKDYYPEYWDNKKSFDLADRIGVSGNVTGINLALEKKPVLPNGISGTIKDTLGNAVMGHVSFYRMKNGRPDKRYTVVSDSLGAYALGNMAVGKYILKAVPAEDYKATYFKYNGVNTLNWREADSVMVDSLHVTSSINFVVRVMRDTGLGRISGTIKGTRNEVVPGVIVYLLNSNNEIFSYAAADKNGKYLIDGITPGTYKMVTDLVDYNATVLQNVSVNYTTNLAQTIGLTVSPNSVTDVEQIAGSASTFELAQNYPNPFNPSTTIRFSIAERSNVRLAVYDMLGKEVSVIASGEMNEGTYNVTFDASKLASGVYLYKLTAGTQVMTRKFVLMK